MYGCRVIGQQFYERREMRFIKGHIGPGDVFIDAGLNVVIYALYAACNVGAKWSADSARVPDT